MRAKWTGFLLSSCLAVCGEDATWADALTYHPLVPCRIVDTRFWGFFTPDQAPNPMVGGEIRAFDAIGTNFNPQGGTNVSCGVPPQNGSDLRIRAEAIAVSLVIVDSVGPGDLRVFPGNLTSAPLASVLNYTANQTIAVGTTIPLRTDQVGDDFKIQADVNGGHVIVDVLGYYSRATVTAFSSVVEGLPASAGTAITRFAPISGIHNAEPTLAQALMKVPPGCAMGRFRAEETAAPGPGVRTYNLTAYTSTNVATVHLTCNSFDLGTCKNNNSVVIPAGSERLAIEAFNLGAVPATNAYLGFELVCE